MGVWGRGPNGGENPTSVTQPSPTSRQTPKFERSRVPALFFWQGYSLAFLEILGGKWIVDLRREMGSYKSSDWGKVVFFPSFAIKRPKNWFYGRKKKLWAG